MQKLKTIFLIVFIVSIITPVSYGKEKKITDATKDSKTLEKEVKKLREKLEVYEKHCPQNAKPLKLTITAAVVGKKLHTSALSKKVKPGQAAISQDHADKVHKWVYIPGLGKIFIADVMPDQWTNRIDYYTSSKSQALKIGKSVKPVAILNDGKS